MKERTFFPKRYIDYIPENTRPTNTRPVGVHFQNFRGNTYSVDKQFNTFDARMKEVYGEHYHVMSMSATEDYRNHISLLVTYRIT